MRILVTGASGMLGYQLVHYFAKFSNFQVCSTSRKNVGLKNHLEFDLLSDDYHALLEWSRPDWVIHCAALTNVDECERNPDLARRVNTDSVAKILSAVTRLSLSSKLIFISSDAVKGDGEKMSDESCAVRPVNVYGHTKAEAEKILLASTSSIVVRTTVVGSKTDRGQRSFCDAIVDNARNNIETRLFSDVWFSPISCFELAERLKLLVESKVFGLFHVSGAERISKLDFGLRLLSNCGLPTEQVTPSMLSDAKLLARRIHEQSLSSKKFVDEFKLAAPTVEHTVRTVFKNEVG